MEIIFQDATEKIDEKWDRTGGKGDVDEPLSVILDDLHFYDDAMDEAEQRLFDLFCFQHIVQDMQAPLQEKLVAFRYDRGRRRQLFWRITTTSLRVVLAIC